MPIIAQPSAAFPPGTSRWRDGGVSPRPAAARRLKSMPLSPYRHRFNAGASGFRRQNGYPWPIRSTDAAANLWEISQQWQRRRSRRIRPLHDRVIVEREEEERTSAGGIVIPDTATEKPIRGKVVATGKGKILEDGTVRPLDVKAGDKVLFGKYSGTEIKIDGDELLVMREDDLMAVIEG